MKFLDGILGKSKNDNVIGYPLTNSESDLDAHLNLRGPPWIRTRVKELPLSTGKVAVYSVVLVHGPTPPRSEIIQIEGSKLNSRTIELFDEEEKEKVVREVQIAVEGVYGSEKFQRFYCI